MWGNCVELNSWYSAWIQKKSCKWSVVESPNVTDWSGLDSSWCAVLVGLKISSTQVCLWPLCSREEQDRLALGDMKCRGLRSQTSPEFESRLCQSLALRSQPCCPTRLCSYFPVIHPTPEDCRIKNTLGAHNMWSFRVISPFYIILVFCSRVCDRQHCSAP